MLISPRRILDPSPALPPPKVMVGRQIQRCGSLGGKLRLHPILEPLANGSWSLLLFISLGARPSSWTLGSHTCDFNRICNKGVVGYFYLLILTQGGDTRPMIAWTGQEPGGTLTQIKLWSLKTHLCGPPDRNGSRSEQERNMEKAVNDGITRIKRSHMSYRGEYSDPC